MAIQESRLFFSLLLALTATGCGSSETEREKTPGTKTGTATTTDGESAEEDTSTEGQALTALFRDELDFEVDELKGDVPCTPVEARKSTVKDEVIPWPEELRRFVVPYLKSLPISAKLPEAVHGFYLVESQVLEEDVGGIACVRASDKKGAIFVNVRHAVEMREETGVGSYGTAEGVSDSYIFLTMRDIAASTIVHEAMHAVDFKFYQYGVETDLRTRDTVFDLSWAEYDQPKDADKISILSLTDGSPAPQAGAKLKAARQAYRGCSVRRSRVGGLALTGASASTLATELRYLAEDTNFIVPYTMANAIEDFAETLTVYHFLTEYQKADRRQVYDQDLTQVPLADATLLYDHDVTKIVDDNPKQKEKLCEFAELIFGEDCRL